MKSVNLHQPQTLLAYFLHNWGKNTEDNDLYNRFMDTHI